ncbi:DUF3291 domain-containing protein [Jannaschia aquimarina]|uniref:Uncharacterized protein n=1 Tax=Jannaschia aquimarina TaxID=935700 RepID=A0A0D1DA60_9RHOB|nr:DUF3291 domain-containing protein [Jannaschia aquimarina]KIT16773.1 hypothetical protein jaqu_15610 [Jannaschia aquimarina]SNS52718.1 hypothetical protein SAMN05421775_101317 [Jannaschia aquimarina]
MIAAPDPSWRLAEVNVARLKAPIDSPVVTPFAEALPAPGCGVTP